MLNAIGLYHFRWRKKKVKSYIIPPTYFRNNAYSIVEVPKDKPQIPNTAETSNTTIEIEVPVLKEEIKEVVQENLTPKVTEIAPSSTMTAGPKVSALSLGSIRAKKELEAQLKPAEKHHDELPTEPFTETQMLEQWIKYANRLGEKGYKILESLLLLNDPKLEGTNIIHELPNESSKIDFDEARE